MVTGCNVNPDAANFRRKRAPASERDDLPF